MSELHRIAWAEMIHNQNYCERKAKIRIPGYLNRNTGKTSDRGMMRTSVMRISSDKTWHDFSPTSQRGKNLRIAHGESNSLMLACFARSFHERHKLPRRFCIIIFGKDRTLLGEVARIYIAWLR